MKRIGSWQRSCPSMHQQINMMLMTLMLMKEKSKIYVYIVFLFIELGEVNSDPFLPIFN